MAVREGTAQEMEEGDMGREGLAEEGDEVGTVGEEVMKVGEEAMGDTGKGMEVGIEVEAGLVRGKMAVGIEEEEDLNRD